jgi:AraC family transcriptional regulator of adaptative response / DNA-3-methyladenine glycosylase II
MPAARRRALSGLVTALARGEIVLDAGSEREEARRRLLALPGIGPWTSEYIAMRALRDPDAFLPSDLGVRHALEQLGHDGRPAAARSVSQRWRPYRAYAVQYLWASLHAPEAATRAATRAGVADRLAA